jgi:hypothetical protein
MGWEPENRVVTSYGMITKVTLQQNAKKSVVSRRFGAQNLIGGQIFSHLELILQTSVWHSSFARIVQA